MVLNWSVGLSGERFVARGTQYLLLSLPAKVKRIILWHCESVVVQRIQQSYEYLLESLAHQERALLVE